MSRKTLFANVAAFGLLAASGWFLYSVVTASDLPAMTVYRSAACGCCGGWVDHMEDAGFDVGVIEDENLMRVKADRRVPKGLHSCHTTVVDGYTVEGHVPAGDVKRMLRERPPVAGIAVGGMPKGSPGMPGIPEPYAVEAFTADGATAVWSRH
jgi:hypothetical protein